MSIFSSLGSLKLVHRAHTYKGEKYLNNNTIMEVISSKLGVKTNEILDVESGNMAVRVALAETEVLEDTRQWLEQQGVRIDVLDVGRERRVDDT